MPKKSAYYHKFIVKTKSGETRTGIYRAASTKAVHNAMSRRYSNPKKITVFKTPAYKLK